MKITHVAISYAGKIWSLPAPNRHNNVIRYIKEQTGDGIRGPDSQGFLLEDGTFLGRRDAYIHALSTGQIKRDPDPEKYQGSELFSEDLW